MTSPTSRLRDKNKKKKLTFEYSYAF